MSISLKQQRKKNMQRTSVIDCFALMSKCVFHLHHCQSQPQSFLFWKPVYMKEWWQILILMYTSLHVKFCFTCVKRPGTVRISYNARYVTTQEKILKKRPVPGRLSNSPVICHSLKSYGISFICDQSIKTLE